MSEMFLMFMYDVLLDDIMIVNSEPIFFSVNQLSGLAIS